MRAADTNVVTYKIETNNDDKIFAFIARKNGGDEVLVVQIYLQRKLSFAIFNNTILNVGEGIYKCF